jgi:ubiquinone/menaquinone biosynthesis C-methylase UbiE
MKNAMTPTNLSRSESQPEVLRVFQSKGETKAFYNKISKVYDLLADRSEEPVRQAGLEKLNARPGEKVLEIGFGTGHCLSRWVSLQRKCVISGPNYASPK